MSEWTDIDSDEEGFARELAPALGQLRARGSQCPRPDLLLAEREGVLPAEMAVDVGAHVARCALCRTLQRDLADEAPAPTPEEARRIAAVVMPKRPAAIDRSPKRAWTWLWRPAPAFATVAVIGVAAWWIAGGVPATPTQVPVPAPPTASPTGSNRLGLPLEKAAVRIPLSTALTWRGGTSDPGAYDGRMAQALAAYRQDDIAGASRQLEALAGSHPTRDVHFYLGVCRLLLDRPADAVASLETARGESGKRADAETDWFLAVAYDRTGRQAEARAELRRVCAASGEHQAAACAILARNGAGR